MYEVELKVRAAHEPVRDRLDALGADRRRTVRQEDTYYDAPHRDFAATDEALRLRTTGPTTEPGEETGAETVELTYKGPLVDAKSKSREEVTVAVGAAETADRLLHALGFTSAATVSKRRERYRLDGTTVTLDDVDRLGAFVEVEQEVPVDEAPEGSEARDQDADGAGAKPEDDAPAAVVRARNELRGLLRDLGLDPDDGIRASYLELAADDS